MVPAAFARGTVHFRIHRVLLIAHRADAGAVDGTDSDQYVSHGARIVKLHVRQLAQPPLGQYCSPRLETHRRGVGHAHGEDTSGWLNLTAASSLLKGYRHINAWNYTARANRILKPLGMALAPKTSDGYELRVTGNDDRLRQAFKRYKHEHDNKHEHPF